MREFSAFTNGAYPFILAEEKAFANSCRLEPYMASGPGGQKRNRTYSAVRATHKETGLSAIAEESRSQLENKEKALKRLRKTIALHLRKDFSNSGFKVHPTAEDLFLKKGFQKINLKNRLYPLLCAVILDAICAAKGKVSEASGMLNLSTGKLNKVISADRDLFGAVNKVRAFFGLNPLRLSKT